MKEKQEATVSSQPVSGIPNQPVQQNNPSQQAPQSVPYQPTAGGAYQQAPQNVSYQPTWQPNILTMLSSKVKTEAIIWIVIASLQALIAVINMIDGGIKAGSYWYRDEAMTSIIIGLIMGGISALNFYAAAKDLKYSRSVLYNPVGVVAKYTPVGPLVVTLVYNVLFGGVFGVVGSIFGFITRSFVMTNAPAFQAMEKGKRTSI